MNAFKVSIATGILVLLSPWLQDFSSMSSVTFISFLISGLIGLAIADLFILQAFSDLGPSRTLMLFGFQPLIIGVLNWLIFSQTLRTNQFYAVIFLIGSLIIFSFESKRSTGTWNMRGLSFALIGVCLDAAGVILTRNGFNDSPDLHMLNGHFIRCCGALIGFAFIRIFVAKINFVEKFRHLNLKDRALVVFGSFLGTFLSLCFYLTAIKIGNISTISSVAITGPLFAGIFECALQKKWPSKYLILATICFIFGFYILVGT
jgi:drug/metabolite transporter (DMT)-like permease